MFDSEANRTINKLATYITGQESTMTTTFLRNAIESSYSDLIGISNNSVDVLKQNMAINMTRWNIERSAHGMASNYAYTSNQMQTTTMWANIGLQAKEFIPMMHSIGIILFACFGCVVVIIALLPHMALPVKELLWQLFLSRHLADDIHYPQRHFDVVFRKCHPRRHQWTARHHALTSMALITSTPNGRRLQAI
nr:conjugal transfer protein TraG N-terminal domain-containing protein [Vibrio parahaemolyticus]